MEVKLRHLSAVMLVASVAACGSSGTTPDLTFSTIKVWTDGAGVGRGESSDGSRAYFLAPDIVEVVAAANAAGTPDTLNPEDFPLGVVYNGYQFREGVIDGANVIIAVPVSGSGGQLSYIYGAGFEALVSTVPELNSIPAGTFNYNGIYVAGHRPSGWKEIGTLDLDANFTNGTFTILASGDDTTLTGSGYVNSSSGQISGSSFLFNDVDYGSYTATIVGGVGGTNAEGVAGVFYTTEDNNPDFAGGFAGQR
jgi:hypothetical protein